jgi:hypothetical protein
VQPTLELSAGIGAATDAEGSFTMRYIEHRLT